MTYESTRSMQSMLLRTARKALTTSCIAPARGHGQVLKCCGSCRQKTRFLWKTCCIIFANSYNYTLSSVGNHGFVRARLRLAMNNDSQEWDRGFQIGGGADSSALGNLEACETELAKDLV